MKPKVKTFVLFITASATALIVLGPKRGKDLAAKAKLPFFFILSEKGGFNELKSAGFFGGVSRGLAS